MADPLEKATATAPATLGEGCLSRYDPEELSAEDGTEFPGAAQLWETLVVLVHSQQQVESRASSAPTGQRVLRAYRQVQKIPKPA